MLFNIIKNNDSKKYKNTVCSLTSKKKVGIKLESLGIPVYELNIKANKYRSIIQFWRLIILLRKHNPDIIQGWLLHGNLISAIVGIIFRKPIIWNIRHSNLPSGLEKKITTQLVNFMKWLTFFPKKIVYNSFSGLSYHEYIGYAGRNSIVIPNGFDTNKFSPSLSARFGFKKKLRLDSDAVLIGMIGRYHPIKDHATFLKAASILSHPSRIVRFVLVGAGCTKNNKELFSLIKKYSLVNSVVLMGERENIHSITAGLDIATTSSSSEGFSNTLGEAMSCGVPCVVTNVGDSAKIVNGLGVVVPAGNPSALANGWSQFIEMEESVRENLGRQARQRIIDQFSIQSVVRKFEKIYDEVIH